MAAIEDRLAELGIVLPEPLAASPGVKLPFELVRVHGELAFTSDRGHRAPMETRGLAAGTTYLDSGTTL